MALAVFGVSTSLAIFRLFPDQITACATMGIELSEASRCDLCHALASGWTCKSTLACREAHRDEIHVLVWAIAGVDVLTYEGLVRKLGLVDCCTANGSSLAAASMTILRAMLVTSRSGRLIPGRQDAPRACAARSMPYHEIIHHEILPFSSTKARTARFPVDHSAAPHALLSNDLQSLLPQSAVVWAQNWLPEGMPRWFNGQRIAAAARHRGNLPGRERRQHAAAADRSIAAGLRIDVEKLRVFFIGRVFASKRPSSESLRSIDVGPPRQHEPPFDATAVAAVPLEKARRRRER